jgi:TM2 domain-containing membrane protein YozV
MDNTMNALNVCGGKGFCEPFDRNDIVNPVFFCRCEPGWTGPECATKQKSQTVAWLLSLLFGPVGADQFYLQWTLWGGLKCFGLFVAFMLSALGFARVGILLVLGYWFSDIVKIGSAPVRAIDGKVAADLPRWAFAAFTLLYFAFIGFAMGVCSVYFKVKHKRRMDDHQRYYGSLQSFNHKVV